MDQLRIRRKNCGPVENRKPRILNQGETAKKCGPFENKDQGEEK